MKISFVEFEWENGLRVCLAGTSENAILYRLRYGNTLEIFLRERQGLVGVGKFTDFKDVNEKYVCENYPHGKSVVEKTKKFLESVPCNEVYWIGARNEDTVPLPVVEPVFLARRSFVFSRRAGSNQRQVSS